MKDRETVCRALSKIAWAYVFLYFNINFGFDASSVSVLPNWMCYVLLWQAIPLLEGDLRDLRLLKPFCILLGVLEGIAWGKALLGLDNNSAPYLWSLLVVSVSLYFHFQLLTALAQGISTGLFGKLAAASGLANYLNMCRDLNAVLQTALFSVLMLRDYPMGVGGGLEGWDAAVMMIPAFVQMIVIAALVFCLFKLRKCVRSEPEEAAEAE